MGMTTQKLSVIQKTIGMSLGFHLLLGLGFYAFKRPPTRTPLPPVKMKVVSKPPEMPKEEVIPPPVKEKPQPKKSEKKKKPISERKNTHPPKTPSPPVQGISADSVVPSKDGPSVPLGNTLLAEDKGLRLPAKDIKDLPSGDPADNGNKDLSADAEMILSSVKKPDYTDEALDAHLEGLIIVDVFVDKTGHVQSAELRKKVGFGMDERILKVVKNIQFKARKNKKGQGIDGWTEVKFKLEIP